MPKPLWWMPRQSAFPTLALRTSAERVQQRMLVFEEEKAEMREIFRFVFSIILLAATGALLGCELEPHGPFVESSWGDPVEIETESTPSSDGRSSEWTHTTYSSGVESWVETKRDTWGEDEINYIVKGSPQTGGHTIAQQGKDPRLGLGQWQGIRSWSTSTNTPGQTHQQSLQEHIRRAQQNLMQPRPSGAPAAMPGHGGGPAAIPRVPAHHHGGCPGC